MGSRILSVESLSVKYRANPREIHALRDVSIGLERGSSLGVVGGSGSGKTTLCLSVMRLLPKNAVVESGRILLDGVDLLSLSEEEMRSVRGKRVSMIFQNPHTSLNPTATVEQHLLEVYELKLGMGAGEARQSAREVLREAGIDHPQDVLSKYPHQLSGGLAQRVLIALAIAQSPEVLIADEPTSALDAVATSRITSLLKKLCDRRGMSLVMVSHDLRTVLGLVDEVVVMLFGQVVERAPADRLLKRPLHPYTKLLVSAYRDVFWRGVVIRNGLPSNRGGCVFLESCPHPLDVCREASPPLFEAGCGAVRCFAYAR